MTSALPTPYASRTAAERFVAGNMLAARFRYADRLGEGGMGEVYKAEDVLLWGLPVRSGFRPGGQLDLATSSLPLFAFADDAAKTHLAAILKQHGLENVRSL